MFFLLPVKSILFVKRHDNKKVSEIIVAQEAKEITQYSKVICYSCSLDENLLNKYLELKVCSEVTMQNSSFLIASAVL